jgi:hypothetical protein
VKIWRLIATAALTLIVACSGGGTSSSQPLIRGSTDDTGPVAWPAPPPDQVAELAKAAGLELETREQLAKHVHAHLDVFIDGEHRTVPAGLGIVINDPAVHTGETDGQPAYGGIQGCDQPCISPLHTHDITGVIHTESAVQTDNTLGQLFKEWDVRFDDTCIDDFCTPGTPVTLYVDGKETPLQGASSIPLTDQKEIAIVIGKNPSRIPNQADFSKA